MILQIINTMAFIEILVLISAVTGIILVLKDKKLNGLSKVLWIFLVLTFNFIGVACFLGYKFLARRQHPTDQ